LATPGLCPYILDVYFPYLQIELIYEQPLAIYIIIVHERRLIYFLFERRPNQIRTTFTSSRMQHIIMQCFYFFKNASCCTHVALSVNIIILYIALCARDVSRDLNVSIRFAVTFCFITVSDWRIYSYEFTAITRWNVNEPAWPARSWSVVILFIEPCEDIFNYHWILIFISLNNNSN